MKKFLASIFLVFYLASSASAFAPLVWAAYVVGPELAPYLAASVGVHLSAAGYAIYKSLTPPSTSAYNVSTAGTISRAATVQWVDLNMNQHTDNVRAKVPMSTIKTIVEANKAAFPLIDDQLNKYQYPQAKAFTIENSTTIPFPVGTLVIGADGKTYSVDYAPPPDREVHYDSDRPEKILYLGTERVFVYYNDDGNTANGRTNVLQRYYLIPSSSNPAKIPRTPDEFAAAIALDGVSGNVKPSVQSEIDRMVADPSYIPTFSDATTGLPYAPPPNSVVASKAQIDTYNATGKASDSASTAMGSAGSASSTYNSAATNAGNNYTASGGNLSTGVGGDPALYQKYLDSKATADAAQAELDKLKAEQDIAAVPINQPAAAVAYGDNIDRSFGSRFHTFMTGMRSSGIFSLPSQVMGSIPSGGSPTMDVSFGRFGSTVFDFSAVFGTSIVLLRTLILIVFSVTGFKIITLKGGSS